MPTWKLYWLEVYDSTENCFVVAKTKQSAISIDLQMCGYNFENVSAELVLSIPPELEQIAIKKHNVLLKEKPEEDDFDIDHPKAIKKITTIDKIWPDYAQEWLLDALGAKTFYLEGKETTFLNGKNYSVGSLGGLYMPYDPSCILSASDFLKKIQNLLHGNWIYRGQRDATWKLGCTMHRYFNNDILKHNRLDYEKNLLEIFKLKSIPYLEYNKIPSNNWEWMVLAQHYGLPTRLLDWTRNPLCALFFAVWRNEGDRDGIIYAYNGRKPINFIDYPDPFIIKKIEILNPPHISQRIIAQNSIFTIEPLIH
ncbi:MAG: FRG domain-containing protein [Gammaproteobacteria bacterium]